MLWLSGQDTHLYIMDIVLNHTRVLAIFVFMGISIVLKQIFKFKAYKYETAAKNSLWTYMETPYQLLFDFFLI